TYAGNVWDNGVNTPVNNRNLVPAGVQWASWPQLHSLDVRHFKATFTFPAGLDPTSTQLTLYDPYYASDVIPINDNIYVFVNGVQEFNGGLSYGMPRDGSNYFETDGWYIPSGATLNSFHSGTNTIDVITEEVNQWGGLGYLALRYGPHPAATP